MGINPAGMKLMLLLECAPWWKIPYAEVVCRPDKFEMHCYWVNFAFVMLYPEHIEQKLGFDQIRTMLAEQCIANPGRELVDAMAFMTELQGVNEALQQTGEMMEILQFHDAFPDPGYDDVRPALKRTAISGTFLEPSEMGKIRRLLTTMASVQDFFKTKGSDKFPALKALTGDVKKMPEVVRRADSILDEKGEIRDTASPELSRIRKTMHQKQAQIAKVMQGILRKAQEEGWIDEGEGITFRDGRMVLPVRATHKRSLRGIVLDASSTGKTVFIEPAEIVDRNNELRELEYEEKREIIRILSEFTDFIRPHAPELILINERLGYFDFIRSKAQLAIRLKAGIPVVRDEPIIEWKDAVHPLLYLINLRENRETVPLSIRLGDKYRILVVSGPNAGGKSVCLKTTGLLQYMLQCGMPVPASPNSVFGIFRDIFIDIGDEQSIENDLSTYSSHLLHMKYFIRHAGTRSLVLIDELGAGTEPSLGGAIAEAILEKLRQTGCICIATTHYTSLKHYAASAEGVFNGAMQFDSGRMVPLYKLEIGKPGSSYAFEIARRIGLPEEILSMARQRVGSSQVDYDKHLREVLRDKRYWEQKREKIRQTEKKIEETLEKYTKELEETNRMRRELLANARKEAAALVEGLNKRIENAIREIREAQAEKEKTKMIRQELQSYVSESLRRLEGENAVTNETPRNRSQKDSTGREEDGRSEPAFEKGDMVRLTDQDITGEVLDVNGPSVLVAFGNMVTTVPFNRLEKTEGGRRKSLDQPATGKTSSAWNERFLSFVPQTDVRGMRGEEALQEVARLLDEALVVGVSEVRILHGKGNGILRSLIRDYLQKQHFVRSFRDEHEERGGSGITVVTIAS